MSWVEKEVNEVCDAIIDCVNKTAPKCQEKTPYKMIRTTNVRNGEIDLENVFNVEKEVYEKWIRRGKPLKNDVILTREAPVGEVGILRVDDTVFLGQRTMMYRAKESVITPHFLYYSLRSDFVQNQLHSFSSGSTVSHVRVPDAKSFKIKLPELPIQKKIADILSAYDDLIENNLKRIKLLEEAAQNIYKEWFVNFRFPNHENTPIDDETGLLVGWEIKPLDEIVKFLGGFAFKSKDYVENGKYKVVTIKNVGDRMFDTSTINYVDDIPEKMKEHCKIEEGQILLSLTGNVGRTCIAYGGGNLLNQRVAILEAKVQNTEPFLYCLFNENSFRALMDNIASGVAQQNLSPVKLSQQELRMPPLKLISDYSETAKVFCSQIVLLLKSNEKLKEARDILLPRLMNRTIEV